MDKKKIYSKWFLIPSMTVFTVMFVIPLILSLFFSLTVWNFDGFTLYVYVDSECVLEFFACIGGKSYSTHWHPADSEIFTLLLELGKKGNAVVFRKPFADSLKLLYFGDKCGCKYSADKIKGRGRYITVE